MREECNQKFDFEPMRALRCGSEGMVEFEDMVMVDQVLSLCGYLAEHLVLVINPNSAKNRMEICKATIRRVGRISFIYLSIPCRTR